MSETPGRLVLSVADVREQYTFDLIHHVNEMLEPWTKAGFSDDEMAVEMVKTGKSHKWIVYPKGKE